MVDFASITIVVGAVMMAINFLDVFVFFLLVDVDFGVFSFSCCKFDLLYILTLRQPTISLGLTEHSTAQRI